MSVEKMCRARKGLGFVLAVALTCAGRAHATVYTGIDLYTVALPSGVTSFNIYLGVPQTAGPGGKVVGSGTGTGNNSHALLWNGTSIATDLNPTNLTGITTSEASATSGTQQVGYGSGTGNNTHALLWNGTSTATDLNPTNLGGIT